MKENIFIEIIKRTLPESAPYIGDDTAYIIEKDLILTQDTIIEDIHFRLKTTSPYYLGRKALAVNLSDIAAAGAIPKYALISLSMPQNIQEEFIQDFYNGVHDICKEYNTIVAGGDLTKSEKVTVSVCLIGFGNKHKPANRKNSRIGDYVITTGHAGSSHAGLYLLEELIKNPNATSHYSEQIRKKFINAHINPIPRVQEGQTILKITEKPAMMDTSDGLADALAKICLMSNVGMQINFDDIPHDQDLHSIFTKNDDIINSVLFGAEDFELVATVSPKDYEKLLKEDFSITKIGEVVPSQNSLATIKIDNKEIVLTPELLDNKLFKHFDND